MNLLQSEKGQSMVGMLVVLVIIGIVFWYMFDGGEDGSGGMDPVETVEKGKQVQMETELNTLRQAIRLYRSRNGRYPSDLDTLVEENHIPRSALTGPNGERYQYNPDDGTVETP